MAWPPVAARAGGGDAAMRIDWRDPDGRPEGAVTRASALRWIAAGLAVVAVHAGGIWLALNWPAAAEAPGDPPAAIMMELAPLAMSPEAPQQDVAPGPQMVEAEDQPEPEKPVDEKVKPEPTPQPPVKTEIKPPELPDVKAAEVVLPPKVEPPKPKPHPKKKKQTEAPLTTAPPSLQTQRADRAAAPAEGLSSSMSAASWRGALMAHLNRQQAFPPGRDRRRRCDGRVHDRPLRPRAVRALGALGRRLRARY